MPTLFDPIQIGRIALANRVVMAPLTRNRAPQAMPTPLMATYYTQRANPSTGAGLIISEATAISHQGQGYADVPGIWSDAQVAAWKPVTEGVHRAGGKIVMRHFTAPRPDTRRVARHHCRLPARCPQRHCSRF